MGKNSNFSDVTLHKEDTLCCQAGNNFSKIRIKITRFESVRKNMANTITTELGSNLSPLHWKRPSGLSENIILLLRVLQQVFVVDVRPFMQRCREVVYAILVREIQQTNVKTSNWGKARRYLKPHLTGKYFAISSLF